MAYTPYGYSTYMPAQQPYQPRQEYAPQLSQQPIQPQQMPQQTNAQGFACRPVTSREEAVAVLADYFSPGTIMPDLGHGCIYLKRFNQNTGASDFYEFALVQQKTEEPKQAPDYSEILQGFGNKLDDLYQLVCKMRDSTEGSVNVE